MGPGWSERARRERREREFKCRGREGAMAAGSLLSLCGRLSQGSRLAWRELSRRWDEKPRLSQAQAHQARMAAAFLESCPHGDTSSGLRVSHPQRADQTSVTARAQRAREADPRRRWSTRARAPRVASSSAGACPRIHQASSAGRPSEQASRKAPTAPGQARAVAFGVSRQNRGRPTDIIRAVLCGG